MISFASFLVVNMVKAAPLPQPVAQTFYMPQPPAMVADFFRHQNSTSPTYQMHILQSVSISQVGAVLVYDHWEDGYEADLNNPVQSTTQIWGDDNPANGIAPGYSKDVFKAGDVVTTQADIVAYETYPTGARSQPPSTSAVIEYDGGDRLGSTRVIGVQAAAWGVPADDDDADPGYQQADMMTVYPVSGPQSRWGTNFILPVGVNSDTEVGLSHTVFSYTGAFIQAGPGGSVIQIDADANGTFEIGSVTLAAGQTYFLNQANNITVNAGARITSTNPVQVFEATGQAGINWGCRTFNIAPTTLWGNDYINPISTGTNTGPDNSGVHRTSVLLRNENATAITINYRLSNGTTGTLAVPAKSTVRYTPPDTGVERNASRYWTSGSPGANFYAVAVADAGPANASSHAFEWGFALIEVNRLTTDGRLAWAPGTVGGGSGINGNVAWFSPVSATTVYIDYDGDPSTGLLTDPLGDKYDYSVAAGSLSFNQVLDPDKNQTGLHVYTLDGTKVALIYGEDGNTSDAQTNLDLGGYLSPSNVNSIGDFVWIDFDNDGIQDAGEPGLANVKVTLTGPIGTVVTRTDSSGKYLFPDLFPGIFTVTVDTSTLPGGMIQTYDTDGTLNSATTVNLAPDTYYRDADFGYRGIGSIGDLVWEDWNASGTRTFGELGINAARVNITYYGADGILGTVDDIAITMTTAADGSYLAQGLPLGKYNVALDPASVLSGYTATTPLSITALQLTLGAPAALTADFGLRTPIIKPLYLSNNGDPWTQALDRVDPVATADLTTSLSTEIGRNDVAQNYNVRETFSVKSYDNQNSNSVPPQPWTSEWIENDLDKPGEQRPQDGNIKVNDGGVGFLEFNLKKLPAQYIQRQFNLNGASSATLTLVIAASELSAANTMLVQVSNNGGSTWTTLETLNSNFNGTKTYANLQSSLALTGNMVLRLKGGVSNGDKKIQIDTATVAWTVPAGIGPTSTVFTMSDPFSSTFTIDAGTITARTYITAAQGNIPLTNPSIPAVLKYGTTTVAALGNPTVTASAAPNAQSAKDDFESNNYSGGTGWGGNSWTEINESDGAASGDEMVLSDGGISLVLKVGKHDEGVYRQINLAGYDYATLSLDWRLLSDTNDLAKGVAVEVSNNGGTTWSRLMLINGAKTSAYTNFTVDITPYIATNTQIRFIGVATDNDVNFDNVKIEYGSKRREYRLDWTFPVATPVTIPAGQSLFLQLTNNIGGNTPFEVQYDSVAKPSQVKLPAATYINVDSIGVYDAPYAGGVAVGQGDPGVTRYLRAVVSDPFGSNDITGLQFIIKAPSGAETVVNGTAVNASGGLKTYEYVWSGAGITNTGTYQIGAVANEGTEGIKAISGTANYNVFVAISGRVINDADGDGNLPERTGEAGITGVTVRLHADANGDGVPDGAALQAVVTGANGAYSFPNLLSGGYLIIETNPNGYTSTNDTSPPNDDKIPVTLVSANLTGQDFLDSINPQITGTVRADTNNDDTGDTPLAGVTVRIYTDPNGDGDPSDGVLYTQNPADADGTVTTAADGSYSFPNLSPGNYVIVQTDLSGYYSVADGDSASDTVGSPADAPNTSGTDNRIPVTLRAGETDAGNDFVDEQPGSITGFVFADTDNNNSGDSGINGVLLTLVDSNGNPVDGNPNVAGVQPITTTTAANGSYSFAGISPGTYGVRETQPSGYASVSDKDGGNLDEIRPITVTAGAANTGNNFVEEQPGTITGTVRADTNNDNTGDTAMANVTLTLVDSSGNPVDGDPNTPGIQPTTTTTDINGNYTFANVPPGTYQVVETDPSGYQSVTPNTVTPVAVTAGATTSNVNFVDERLGSISGSVLVDTNNDPVGDTGLGGVLLTLLDAAGDPVDADPNAIGVQPFTATTLANGSYVFTGVAPGTYSVVETQPTGYHSIGDVDGGNLEINGDVIPITVSAGQAVTGQNFIERVGECIDDWDEWKLLHPGEVASGNPDGDLHDNLTEFAFVMEADSGEGDTFRIQPSTTNPGTIEAVFTRPIQALENVVYTLQYAVSIGNPTVWASVVLEPSMYSTVQNTFCTEIVTIHNLEGLPGMGTGTGIVRIVVELDEENDAVVDHTSHTNVEGWKETPFGICCQTFNTPYMSDTVFTGRVNALGINGQVVDFSASSGATDFAALLSAPGAKYYLEITGGSGEGNRYDIVSGSGSTVTLAADTILDSAAAPYNTVIGAPSGFGGSDVVIRRHRTLAEIFPPSGFFASTDETLADEIQIYAGGVWTILHLLDDGGTPRWVDNFNNLVDRGNQIIAPGQGLFLNNRGDAVTLLAYGEVRENDFIRPLGTGSSLVGGGYPLDQSTTGSGSRVMTLAKGFYGSRDFKTADSFFVWKGDATPGTNGYDSYYLLNGAPQSPSLIRWVKVGDAALTSRDTAPLMLQNRAVFTRSASGLPTYGYPTPWTADAPPP